MRTLKEWLDVRFYPGVRNNWDDVLFRDRIIAHLSRGTVVLDLGAGSGIVEQMNFRGLAGKVCGIDLEPRVLDNPYLDEGRVTDGREIPYPDAHFDLVFSDNVFEHLEIPFEVFQEVHRVLKPGGRFLFKTPNKYHYVPLIASLTPHNFHQVVNRWRGRDFVDTFPTRYRANSRGDIEALSRKTGFRVRRVEQIESRPEYLRLNAILYTLGIVYERIVNRFSFLSSFRVLLVGELSKEY